jgi:hypothetical protein
MIEDGDDVETTSYLFYHEQEGDRLRRGGDDLYLAHDIKEKDVAFVMEIVKGYGGSWNGSANTTICIPFIDYTPEKLKELEEEEVKRQKRIVLIATLRKEGAGEDVIDKWLERAVFQSNAEVDTELAFSTNADAPMAVHRVMVDAHQVSTNPM